MPGELRRFRCGFCGTERETRDARKKFCDKRCADRSRNSVYQTPVASTAGVPIELQRFGKLDLSDRIKVLSGEAGFSVVSFDIEATNLKPNVGRILCCSFKPIGQDPYTFSGLEPRFKRADVYDDSALAAAIRDELEKYDIIVGWNSKMFDVKYINSRCIHGGERTKEAQYHVDGMWSWRSKMLAWSSLKSVQTFLPQDEIEHRKTAVAWEQWMRALGWDKKKSEAAFAQIIEHCELDVIVLEEVYRVMVEANVIRSIRRDGGVL